MTGGAIEIDGHDIREIKRQSLTRQMGVVLQQPYLFSGTVRENITYGRLDATDEEIRPPRRRWARTTSSCGWSTGTTPMLHQRGQNLSLGQRQLISFARAMRRRAAHPRAG